MNWASIVLGLLLLHGASLAEASPWEVVAGERDCTVLAQARSASGAITVGWLASPTDQTVDVLIFGLMTKVSDALLAKSARLAVLPADPPIRPNAEAMTSALGRGVRFRKTGLMRADLGAVQRLRLTMAGLKPLMIELENPAAATAKLGNCVNSLLTSWGMESSMFDGLMRWPQPVGDEGKWFLPSDLPREWTGAGEVHVRFLANTNGRVEACRALSLSADLDFATHVCAAFERRGRFRPALDAARQPKAVFQVRTVRWWSVPD